VNNIFSSIGTDTFDQIIDAAELFGCTGYIQPTSVTYYLGPKTQTYNPDTGLGNATWTKTVTITDILVGGFENELIIQSDGNIKASDIQLLFKQSELTSAPTTDDQVSYNSATYEFVGHRAAAGLYLVHMRLKTGAA